MADYEKHRMESINVAADFEEAMNDGDSLSAVSSIGVFLKLTKSWTDRSSDFGSLAGSISGTEVRFTLGAASPEEQEAGFYKARIVVDTSDGETLVATPSLDVNDVADPGAP